MPWVRFNYDFTWRVRNNVEVSYKNGHQYLVTQACADEAVETGNAVKIDRDRTSKNASR